MYREDKNKPVVICLTPIKNEVWILDRFLKAASLWADYIILSDQGSTDGSIEIAKKYSKVVLLENKELPYFDEYLMRKPLFDAAREIEGDRILISLDADEFLTPNWEYSKEWETILSSPQGTIINFPWLNINPDFETYWENLPNSCMYVDDNTEFKTGVIHASRLPRPFSYDEIYLKEIKILHYQYTDWERMLSKHRWYQCVELIKMNNNPVDVFRRYHHMYEINEVKLKPVQRMWFDEYTKYGIDITSIYHQSMLLWERTVLDYMNEFGTSYFRHLNIWTVNWCNIAQKWNYPNPEKYKDPRKKWEKAINKWLIRSQKNRNKYWVRMLDRIISRFY